MSEAVEEVVRARMDFVVKAGLEATLRALRANIWRVGRGEKRAGMLHNGVL